MEKCVESNCCGFFGKGHKQKCMSGEIAKSIIDGLKERSPTNFSEFLGYSFGIFSYDHAIELTNGLKLDINSDYIQQAFPDQDVCYAISILCEDLKSILQNHKLFECVVKLQSMKKYWDSCVLHEPIMQEFLKIGYSSEEKLNFVHFCKVCLDITDDEVHEICRNTRKRKKHCE